MKYRIVIDMDIPQHAMPPIMLHQLEGVASVDDKRTDTLEDVLRRHMRMGFGGWDYEIVSATQHLEDETPSI
jgi:hypothetical protein